MSQGLWIAEGSFEIRRTVNASTDAVRALFLDTDRWLRLQPLIVEVHAEAEHPGFFRITDRMQFLGVPFRTTYRARIEPGADGVDAEAWSRPSVHLENHIRWTAQQDQTKLLESVRVKAPRPLLSFVLRTANEAHEAMFDHICGTLEQTQVEGSRG